MKKLLFLVALPLAALGMPACAGPAASTKADARPLYDRLGGKDAVTAVVDEFVRRIAADNVINARFANADMPHLKAALVEQICAASGGPCKYTGKDMKTAHTGMKITEEEWTAIAGDLKGALDQFKVGATEQGQLLGAVVGMKPDIVGQ
jgi:hemoglobin